MRKKLILGLKFVLAIPLIALYLVTGLMLCLQERWTESFPPDSP